MEESKRFKSLKVYEFKSETGDLRVLELFHP
jgi:hypothetical protein